jgi:hypothetical protein
MRAAHYNLMRLAAIPVFALAIFFIATPCCVAQQSTQQQSLLKTSSLDAHEGLTISALPWNNASQYKQKFPKKSPYSAGVIAVQVAFRNDSDDAVRVTLSRIRLTVHLDAENTQELPSLSPEEVARAVVKPGSKDPTQRRVPLPLPIPSGGGKNGKMTELEREASDAAVPTGVIAPHSTVEGLLYFDLQDQYDLLQTAHLYVPDIVRMSGDRPLTYFDIDLGRQATP